jgi:hypothetical protein
MGTDVFLSMRSSFRQNRIYSSSALQVKTRDELPYSWSYLGAMKYDRGREPVMEEGDDF